MLIDSEYKSINEALHGAEIPADIRNALALVDVRYVSFDEQIHAGQLVVHKDLVQDIEEVFNELLAIKFPIKKVVPITVYGWNDEASMQDNNTSAFNYRTILGTELLSNHSYGRAIDINPLQNPWYSARDGNIYPAGAIYDPNAAGTIVSGDAVIHSFKQRNWIWYGDRNENMDYQHFQKL